jgi:TetR/AcrR family hemagglutinin/protease transcriptional regulator
MSSSTAARRPRAPRLSPEARRASLVAAGIHVVARRGLSGARPVDVADEARVSEATIYAYFPNRDALIDAVLDEVGRHFLAITKTAFETATSLPERYAAVFEAIGASAESDPDHARVWFDWASAMRGELGPRFLEAQSRLTEIMVSAVRSTPKDERAGLALHPDDAAHLVLGAGEMMVRLQLAGRKRREIRRFVRSTLSALFPDM